MRLVPIVIILMFLVGLKLYTMASDYTGADNSLQIYPGECGQKLLAAESKVRRLSAELRISNGELDTLITAGNHQ